MRNQRLSTNKFENYLTTPELIELASKKLHSNYIEVNSGLESSPCKIWKGGKKCSYGYVYIAVIEELKVYALTHRLAWFLRTGSIPPFDRTDKNRLEVIHGSCNNPLCFEHISLGTPKDNGNDKIRDGNSNRGERNPFAMLSEFQVKEIYALVHSGKYTQKQIADHYRIHQTTVSKIKLKQKWGWLN